MSGRGTRGPDDWGGVEEERAENIFHSSRTDHPPGLPQNRVSPEVSTAKSYCPPHSPLGSGTPSSRSRSKLLQEKLQASKAHSAAECCSLVPMLHSSPSPVGNSMPHSGTRQVLASATGHPLGHPWPCAHPSHNHPDHTPSSQGVQSRAVPVISMPPAPHQAASPSALSCQESRALSGLPS